MCRSASSFVGIFTFLLAVVAAGCGGGASTPLPQTVVLNPSGVQVVGQGQSVTILANENVDWNLAGPGSLSDESTTSVTYHAPETVTSDITAQVSATSLASHNDVAMLTIQVNPPPALAIATKSLPDGSVGVPYAVELQAVGGVQPYSWSVSSGSLPAWASLDHSTGLLSGTPDAGAETSFAIEVSDSQSTPATATQSLSLNVNTPVTVNNTELKGQYAFLLQGFDEATQKQFVLVGGFQADGNGNITAGIEDSNGPDGYKSEISFSGTYNVGNDNRGFAKFTNSSGSATFALAVGSVDSRGVATKADIIEFDSTASNRVGSGFVFTQDPGAFNLSSIKGPYAFQTVGQADQPATRMVATGAYTADGNGNLTNGDEEFNNNGSADERSFTGTFSTTASTSSFGRVGLQVVSDGGTSGFILYIVNSGHALTMSTGQESTSGLMSGEVRAQGSTSFSDSSLDGAAVGYSEGDSSLSIGQWNFDSAGNAAYNYLSGDAGGINYNVENPESGALSYSVAADGRVTTSGSLASGVLQGAIFYLVDTNEGYVMSTDSSASAGYFEPQTGGPFSNSSLSGNYMLGSIAPAVASSQVDSGVLASPGDGTFEVTFDTSDPGGTLSAGLSISEQVLFSPDGSGEDGDLLPDYIYMISPRKAVGIWERPNWPVITIIEK